MWRAIMMSFGLCLVILGGEAMVVDRVVLAAGPAGNRADDVYGGGLDSPYSTSYDDITSLTSAAVKPAGRVIVPPEWAPWALLSAGVLTFLYASGLSVGE